jgi:hypothetical protein
VYASVVLDGLVFEGGREVEILSVLNASVRVMTTRGKQRGIGTALSAVQQRKTNMDGNYRLTPREPEEK